jgi:hypothetical protein
MSASCRVTSRGAASREFREQERREVEAFDVHAGVDQGNGIAPHAAADFEDAIGGVILAKSSISVTWRRMYGDSFRHHVGLERAEVAELGLVVRFDLFGFHQ